LFYFREGYLDTQYTEEFWKLRETMEKSSAIKCPDIYTQITNCKYFQYLINKKETWDHFGFSDEEFMTNRDTFCDILTTGDFNEDKEKMKNYILENGGFDLFVLKP
jgi:Eukaryotic glutathione synthase